MLHRNLHRITSLGLILSFVLLHSSFARADGWKEALSKQLKEIYPLTKTGEDRNRIGKHGIVLVIQKENIVGDKGTDLTFTLNKVRDGQVVQDEGWTVKRNAHTFEPGERLYVFDIDVKDHEIWFKMISCDTFPITRGGWTEQTRYKTLINFQFPKDYLATADITELKEKIGSVLVIGSEASAPKSIELGQTAEQVEAILGKPEKIIKLGPKTVYVYKDMKIIFIDSKVADVQ